MAANNRDNGEMGEAGSWTRPLWAWVTAGLESHFLVLSFSILKWKEEPTGGISQREIKMGEGRGCTGTLWRVSHPPLPPTRPQQWGEPRAGGPRPGCVLRQAQASELLQFGPWLQSRPGSPRQSADSRSAHMRMYVLQNVTRLIPTQ